LGAQEEKAKTSKSGERKQGKGNREEEDPSGTKVPLGDCVEFNRWEERVRRGGKVSKESHRESKTIEETSLKEGLGWGKKKIKRLNR